MGRLRRLAAALRWLMALPPEARDAVWRLGTGTAGELGAPARAPGVDPAAIVHPLASVRFAERVEIGPKASIGPFCCVWGGWSRTWARVGAGALLSPGVVLVAGNHRTAGRAPVRDLGFEELDVEVGPGAWIGAHATVIGCRVGEGAVVGANAVVTEDIPAGAIAAGIPARVIGWREGWEPQPSHAGGSSP